MTRQIDQFDKSLELFLAAAKAECVVSENEKDKIITLSPHGSGMAGYSICMLQKFHNPLFVKVALTGSEEHPCIGLPMWKYVSIGSPLYRQLSRIISDERASQATVPDNK